jgi:hypothetical protein
MLPISNVIVALEDAERINPNISYAQMATDRNGIPEELG